MGISMEPLIVFFDLESTGLDTEYDEILQIGAVSQSGSSFSVFILPQVPISDGAARVNNFSMEGRKLMRDGKELDSVNMEQGIQAFFNWCTNLARDFEAQSVALVAHNGKNFDFKLLTSCMKRFDVKPQTTLTIKMLDSILCLKPLAKQFGNVRLQTLKSCLLQGGSQTHDAVDDCNDLKDALLLLAGTDGISCWTFLNIEGAHFDGIFW